MTEETIAAGPNDVTVRTRFEQWYLRELRGNPANLELDESGEYKYLTTLFLAFEAGEKAERELAIAMWRLPFGRALTLAMSGRPISEVCGVAPPNAGSERRMKAREAFDAWNPKPDGSIGGPSYWSVWKAAWDAAKEEVVEICDEQAERARTSTGSARACACADRIRAL